MTDEFDERLSQGLPDDTVRRDDVPHAEEREEHADPDDLQRLKEHVLPPKPRQTLVPDRC